MSSMFKLVMLINIENVRDTNLYNIIKQEFDKNSIKKDKEFITVTKQGFKT